MLSTWGANDLALELADEMHRPYADGGGGAMKTVYDPEIPSDIYELGLIYRVDIADDRKVTVDRH